jgi:hypothetical protein
MRMRILAGVEGGWRTIRVVDADRGQRAALVELGFGPDLVRRYPPGTRHFDRAVANLRQWLDEMVRQRMTGAAPGWAGALGDLLDRAGQARVPHVVVGSLALAVRGVDARPGDIDVITTVEGADALGTPIGMSWSSRWPTTRVPGYGAGPSPAGSAWSGSATRPGHRRAHGRSPRKGGPSPAPLRRSAGGAGSCACRRWSSSGGSRSAVSG